MVNSRYKQYASPDEVPTRQMLEHPSKAGIFVPVHRRPMRLPGVDYTNASLVCFVTFNIHRECNVRFIDVIGQRIWQALLDEMNRIHCCLYAACLMPDHVHLLISPSGKGESISDVVRRVKTRCCTLLRQEQNVYLHWQSSFYDHILRDNECAGDEFEAIKHYIYSNPERAELGEDYRFRTL
jgi:putative transposase